MVARASAAVTTLTGTGVATGVGVGVGAGDAPTTALGLACSVPGFGVVSDGSFFSWLGLMWADTGTLYLDQ